MDILIEDNYLYLMNTPDNYKPERIGDIETNQGTIKFISSYQQSPERRYDIYKYNGEYYQQEYETTEREALIINSYEVFRRCKVRKEIVRDGDIKSNS